MHLNFGFFYIVADVEEHFFNFYSVSPSHSNCINTVWNTFFVTS